MIPPSLQDESESWTSVIIGLVSCFWAGVFIFVAFAVLSEWWR